MCPLVRQSVRVPQFLVLAKVDGTRWELVCSDQRAMASEHGFTLVEFSVDAPTRGFARKAWDARRSGREIRYEGQSSDDEDGLESLSDAERAAVVGLVRALVEKDRDALEAAGAYQEGPDADPYMFTQPYGPRDRVDLVMPPGDARHWAGGVIRDDKDPAWVGLVVDMWTEQEGPSELSLEADLFEDEDGDISAQFIQLHVM